MLERISARVFFFIATSLLSLIIPIGVFGLDNSTAKNFDLARECFRILALFDKPTTADDGVSLMNTGRVSFTRLMTPTQIEQVKRDARAARGEDDAFNFMSDVVEVRVAPDGQVRVDMVGVYVVTDDVEGYRGRSFSVPLGQVSSVLARLKASEEE